MKEIRNKAQEYNLEVETTLLKKSGVLAIDILKGKHNDITEYEKWLIKNIDSDIKWIIVPIM